MNDGDGHLDSVRVLVAGVTDVGAVRERNEDALRIGDLDRNEIVGVDGQTVELKGPRGALLVVCDGMGGAAGGDIASELAATTIWSEMAQSQATSDRDVLARLLRRATRKANKAVRSRAAGDRSLAGMGTTSSVAAVAGTTVVLAQVGDSRAYLLRGGSMTQVTRDQSVVSVLVSAGKMSKPEANFSPSRNVILQALGADPDVVVGLSFAELRRGDRLLLCSDGLHSYVSEPAIALALSAETVGEACKKLVERAGQAGAPDNVTVAVAEFEGEALVEPEKGKPVEFSELDPSVGGDAAVTHTSRVIRRLAAKAGLLEEPFTEDLPATGMYSTIPEQSKKRRFSRRVGPARERWQRQARLGGLAWVALGIAILAALAMILWR